VKIRRFRDSLAVLVWATCIVIFCLHGSGVVKVPEMVLGALISCMTLVVQFYFRKKPREEAVEPRPV